MSQPFVSAPDKVGLGTRLGARLLDGLILFIPILLVTGPVAGGFQIGSGNQSGRQIVATALGVLLSYIYFVGCEAIRGATFGKSACRITISGMVNGLPSVAQAAKRNGFMLVAIVPGTLGGFATLAFCVAVAITIARDPHGRGLHDRWAGTGIVDRD
jgi:uncharacterized RDD family membrane protein YckC